MTYQTNQIKNNSDINITDDFQQALDLVNNSDDNLFLTGKAGTGKSTFLKYLKSSSPKNMAVLAPTGVSALNISGQTIHSFFKFKPRFIDKNSIRKKSAWKIYKNLDLLVIDEISMVRADIFDAIERFLRLNGPTLGKPFGGVQICVIGDLYQLQPIVSNNEADIFYSYYETPFFYSSEAYDFADFKVIELKEIFRQKDKEFIDFLEKIRSGNTSNETLSYINQRHLKPDIIAKDSPLILTTTNKRAEFINHKKITSISNQEFLYIGETSGKFSVNDSRLPSPLELKLKVGTQVMFNKNDNDKRWVNGTIGTVRELSDDNIKVEVKNKYGSYLHEVKKSTWESIEYNVDKNTNKIKEKVVGKYKQYPLILAWAVTIHKSQGRTLESVYIDLANGAFAPGQLYVALSRCTDFEKIILKEKISYSDIKCDSRVVEFMTTYNKSLSKVL